MFYNEEKDNFWINTAQTLLKRTKFWKFWHKKIHAYLFCSCWRLFCGDFFEQRFFYSQIQGLTAIFLFFKK